MWTKQIIYYVAEMIYSLDGSEEMKTTRVFDLCPRSDPSSVPDGWE